jgi:hypothetical protein
MTVRVKLTKHFGPFNAGETVEVESLTAEHIVRHGGGEAAPRSDLPFDHPHPCVVPTAPTRAG